MRAPLLGSSEFSQPYSKTALGTTVMEEPPQGGEGGPRSNPMYASWRSRVVIKDLYRVYTICSILHGIEYMAYSTW